MNVLVWNGLLRFFVGSGIACLTLLLISCASPPTNPTGTGAYSPNRGTQPLASDTQYKAQKRIYFGQNVGMGEPIQGQSNQVQPNLVQSSQLHSNLTQSNSASTTKHYHEFGEWKQDFLNKAAASYDRQTVQSLFGQASFRSAVVSLDSNQAEFVKSPWQYLDAAVTNHRVAQAQQKRREMTQILTYAENRYGVPASIITAIWAVESSFGANMGNTNLVDALSSLAYEGRRRQFAENQLLAMAQLVRRGDVFPHELKGSYAGGMGHTQFIPTTWLSYGVDGDNDGKISPFAKADALTSTANYLASSGWVPQLPAYIEVNLPANFDYRWIGQKLALSQWATAGLTSFDFSLTGNHMAQLWLPAGIQGPKLLLTPNFEVIKVYNNSSNYALAVATLAERMNGKTGIRTNFPRHEQMLSSAQVQVLQQRLTALGYDTKGADGVLGSNTRTAFARWQADNRQVPDGFVTQNSAKALLAVH